MTGQSKAAVLRSMNDGTLPTSNIGNRRFIRTGPVGRANSPGYGHLKLPHLKIGRAADLRRVKQDVYFRSLQPRRGWGVERLEATAAKHSIYVT
jgi:hypothetical protein